MHKKGFLKGAAFGAIIGSVAALFMAPKSGDKTRADVKKLVDTLSKRIMKDASAMNKISQETYDKLVKRSVSEYARDRKLADNYLDEVTSMLKSQWKVVKKELNEVDKQVAAQKVAVVKKLAKRK